MCMGDGSEINKFLKFWDNMLIASGLENYCLV